MNRRQVENYRTNMHVRNERERQVTTVRKVANYPGQTKTFTEAEPPTFINYEEVEPDREPYWVITVQHHSEGPIIRGKISNKPVKLFLDTGSMVNLVSRDALQKLGPKVRFVEPLPFSLQGVTGNKLTTLGETKVTITLSRDLDITIPVVVVEESVFPGDILLGYITMSVENILVSPAERGAQVGDVFLPFINPCKHANPGETVPLIQNEDSEEINNVAERSSNLTQEEECKNKQITKSSQKRKDKHKQSSQAETKREARVESSDEILQTASGHVIECTLLPSMTVSKVKLELKGVKKDVEVITLPETARVRGIQVDSAVYVAEKGRVEILVTSTLNKDITLKKGTQIGLFHVCKHPIKIVNNANNTQEDSENTVKVCPVQEDLELGRKYRYHLKSTSRPDLEQNLVNLLLKHREAVALPGDALGKTTLIKHQIKLKKGTQPIYIPAYRLPHSKLATVDKIINEMLSQEVIEHSSSEWNFPLILVPKPDGTVRPVIDYRELNKHTIPDRLPLPVISDILRSLGTENTLFSTIDIKSAFWQIELQEDSKDFTAFSTPTGHYRFNRMPMGLSNSPLTYVKLMNTVLKGLIGTTASVFLDDILISSKTEEEHFRKLDLVFSRLKGAGLKVKLEKCNFLQDKVIYLGHQIDRHGLRTVVSKVEAVRNFPIPKKVENVRSFLGLTGYYRQFIKGYASIAHPLTSLLKKDVTFIWGEEHQQAFDALKEKLISSPVLIFPDYSKEFILCTDASDIGLGGILMQERKGKLQPIAYASRLCTAAERNYSITERETLAIIYCLEHFRDMILGYKIRVWTDHTAIQNLFKHKNLRGRLARWFVTLQNYDVTFEYIPGKKNTAADALSRNITSEADSNISSTVCSVEELIVLDEEEIRSEQMKEEFSRKIITYLENKSQVTEIPKLPATLKIEEFAIINNLLYRVIEFNSKDLSRKEIRQLVIPQKLIPEILKIIHDSSVSSHPGKDKTYKQAQMKYFWIHMRKDIYKYVDNCQKCAETKGSTRTPAPMLSYPIPSEPWERIHIDTLELPMSENGSKYLFVAIDYFSRFCILQPMTDKKAETVASVIFNEIITTFSTPRTIITDNGSEFNNKILEELCRIFNIKKINVQTYHPQSNGVVERLNRKIINCLRSLINPYSINWDTWIPHVKCALNTQINSATSETPHYIIFGKDKILPYELFTSEQRPIYNYDDYVANNVQKFQSIHNRVREHMKTYSEEMKQQQHKTAKPVKINVGNLVMAKIHVPIGTSNKLSPKFTGPYKVIETAGGNKFKVQHIHSGEVQIRHLDELKHISMTLEEGLPIEGTSQPQTENNDDVIDDTDETHEYRKKLRSHTQRHRHSNSDEILLICNITELFLQDEFEDYVNKMLEELEVDINSFYR